MKLLDELRKVEPGKPGHWSTRVSVLLACVLFILVTALGMQIRVRGQTLPQLENAEAALGELRQQLESALLAQDRVDLLRAEVSRLQVRLDQTGVRIPEGPGTLDLAVALSTASDDSPVREVRPWRPAGEASRALPYVGGEIEVVADYGGIIQFLHFVLTSGPLRELAGIAVEPAAETATGGLRATARMLAYFGNDGYAAALRSVDVTDPPHAPINPPHADLRSPFGAGAGNATEAAAGEPIEGAVSQRPAGHIRVGDQRYELMEDPGGNIRLKRRAP